MTYLDEAINLYRNDSHVSDAFFKRMIIDAIECDTMSESDPDLYSIKVPYLLTSDEFEQLVREGNY